MNKSEFVGLIAEKGSITKVEAEKHLNNVTAAITEAVRRGEGVSLIGFGSFSVANRAARNGINPKTREAMNVPAYNAVLFKAGAKLKEACNSTANDDKNKTKSKDGNKPNNKADVKGKAKSKATAKATKK